MLKADAGAITVARAGPDEQPILANMLELYAHDFSQFLPIDLGAHGRFGYSHLPLYWTEEGRHPLLIRGGGQLAGFALVKRESLGPEMNGNEDTWDMAEFFVLRRYRRLGIGTRVLAEVLNRFPGRWQIRVMESNADGLGFWARAISQFAGEPVPPMAMEKDGAPWRVFSFASNVAGKA